MASVHSGEEILSKASTYRVGCTNVTDDRQTDRQTDRRQTELRQQRPERNVSHVRVKTSRTSNVRAIIRVKMTAIIDTDLLGQSCFTRSTITWSPSTCLSLPNVVDILYVLRIR